ncbi:GNAT family N-acetyltransferase [Streptomyces sp. NPDC006879]|uniref:GNAT family N-acetyltransferase n=1 Tax=Streptomyces sp. NPDC006879 TaxID=3364767 RepID=UPI00368C5AF3
MDIPQRVIELDDLTLRAFNGVADLPELFQVIEESLEHLRPWMPWVAEHSLARTTAFLDGRAQCWASGEEFTYAIVREGALVGACGLLRHDDTPPDTREIGYWLHPAATGRGVATRTARALAEQAFRLPGVDHVEIVHDPANTASGAVPARLGFTPYLRRPAEPLAPAETGEVQIWRLDRGRARPLAPVPVDSQDAPPYPRFHQVHRPMTAAGREVEDFGSGRS